MREREGGRERERGEGGREREREGEREGGREGGREGESHPTFKLRGGELINSP